MSIFTVKLLFKIQLHSTDFSKNFRKISNQEKEKIIVLKKMFLKVNSNYSTD